MPEELETPKKVSVVAPLGIDNDLLIKHLREKAKWIIQKLFEIKEIQSQHLDREYVNGEAFMYLGRNYSLMIEDDDALKKPLTKFFQGKFIISTPIRTQDALKTSMELWYRDKAMTKIVERVAYYQKYFDIEPIEIKVKEQKKRWIYKMKSVKKSIYIRNLLYAKMNKYNK